MTVTPQQAQQVFEQADCLHDAAEIARALDTMAGEISNKLQDKNPLVLTVLTGGIIPAGQLLTRLNFPLETDYIHATRYGSQTRGGALEWIARPRCSLQGRTILIVDDILDEGLTLQAIVESCKKEGAAEVYTAVMVEKLHSRKADLKADFIGLQVEDRYVFGFGMDYKGYLRNYPAIYAVAEE